MVEWEEVEEIRGSLARLKEAHKFSENSFDEKIAQ